MESIRVKFYYYLLVILGFILSFILVINDTNWIFSNIYILPLFFSLIFCVFRRTVLLYLNTIPGFILLSLLYVRDVLAPYILYLGNYVHLFNMITKDNVNSAIILMCYELFVLLIYMSYFLKRNQINYGKILVFNKSFVKLPFIICFLILILILLYILFPSIKEYYISIFSTSNINSITSSNLDKGSADRAVFFVFSFMLNIVRLIFPVYFITQLKNRFGDSSFVFFISVIFLLLQFFFIGEELMFVLIVDVVLIMSFIQILPKKKKMYIYIIGCASTLVLFYLVILKSSADEIVSNSYLSTLGIMFQAYLPGITNISGGFLLNDISHTYDYLWNDITYIIPFKSLFFKNRGDILNVVYTYQNDAQFQILPFISQLYYYVGFISPLFTCIILRISFFYYRKMNNVDVLKYSIYLMICIYFAVTPVFYNLSILGLFYTSCFIPFLLLLRVK